MTQSLGQSHQNGSSSQDKTLPASGPGGPTSTAAKDLVLRQGDAQNPLRVLHRLRQNPDSTEFVYMLPYHIDEITPLNPYHLEIVQHADVHDDFYTLSSFGVTHFQQGKPAFTSLEQWKRENYLFNSIIKIPVFRKFRVWKAFKLWRMAVRFGKMNLHKRTLEKNLYWLSPVFQPALLQIRRLCVELSTTRLHSFKKGHLYALQEFLMAQLKQKQSVLTSLDRFWVDATETVRAACVQTLEALEQRLFGDKGEGAVPTGVDKGTKDKLGGGASPRATSFKYTVMASKRVVHKRLYMFLQLSDYVIFSTLHSMVVWSLDDLVGFMTEPPPAPPTPIEDSVEDTGNTSGVAPGVADLLLTGEKKKVDKASFTVFLTEVLYEDSDLTLRPGRADFEGELEVVVSGFIEAVSGPRRLLNNEELESYTHLYEAETENADEDVTTVVEMISTDSNYQGLVHDLKNAIDHAVTQAEQYKETFVPFKHMVAENDKVDVEELRAGAEDKEITLNDFHDLIVKYGEQSKLIANLPPDKDVGIMRVDTQKLKETFAPSPVACLHQLEVLLPELAAKQQKALLEEVNTGNSRLKRETTSPSDYVDQLSFMDELTEQMDSLQERFDEVSSHYRLMEDFDIKVPDMDRASFTMLIPEFMGLKTQLDISQGNRDDNVQKWSGELDKEITMFHEKVKELEMLASNEQILQETEYFDPVLDLCTQLKDKCTELEQESSRNSSYQQTFGAIPARYPELENLSSDISLKLGMWETMRDFIGITKVWAQTLMEELDNDMMNQQVAKWYKTAARAERELPTNNVAPKLKKMVQRYKDTVPVCADLRNPALQLRHWDKIEETIGAKLERDPETWSQPFTLQVLLDMNVMLHKDAIAQISTEATQEGLLEEMLNKIKGIWAQAELQCLPFKDQKEVYILGGVDEIQALLDDSMVTMGTITASRFVAGIRTEVDKMEGALQLFSETLDEWLQVQRNWMYLEPIFSAPDIQRQLPLEAKQFQDVDRGWKAQMKKTNEQPKALRAGTANNLLSTLQQWNDALDKIQKSLEDYLETKRMAFPRFYFLSNDELLEILAQTRNVQAVQPHMNKCFDAIKSLDFGPDPKSIDIYSMYSGEGEMVTLGKNPIKARGNVENWLYDVEKGMVKSLRALSKLSVQEFPTRPRHEWVMDHAAQIIILGAQVFWCLGTAEALNSPDVPEQIGKWRAFCVEQLNALCALVRGELTDLQRMKLVALITIDVHNRDIVDILIEENVLSERDFGWQMRLRYSWDETIESRGELGDCVIQQVQARFLYAYEYLGASSRLVITPLTDRCYMTLTGAMDLKLGGAPAGPAGTGKTESTKDLAKALGRQCVVFNCGENLDYKFMGKFFKGLAQCGAWACFDEFNRINIEVLSVIAQQIITIQIALRAEVSKFMFEGLEIKLVPTFGVFITMNPGYAGRTELPDNLKALFRPMSMMIPDYALVAEVMLFSEGFEMAKVLSRKMVKLYKLSSEQLSQQDHYDFGMRAVKSVLVMAGSLKRANPDLTEDIVLIRAMRDSNVPKFLKDDVILFQAIVGDLFPGVEVPLNETGDLQTAIVDGVAPTAGLILTDEFILKVVQLYETFTIRFGVMTVGPTGGGKSTVAHTLANACSLLRNQGSSNDHIQVTHMFTLNPKSISMGELYGNFNLLTNEWTDGLGSTIIRTANNDTSPDRKWIVFDGPVDAVWIENMNTVLDDNRTLCLPNGERIKLNGVTMRMLFEVEDLKVASPATVSRCGMVWVPSAAVGWAPVIQTWCNTKLMHLPEATREQIISAFDQHIDNALRYVRRECREDIPTVDLNLVVSTASILESLCQLSRGIKLDLPEDDLAQLVNRLLAFSVVWGIGGNVDLPSKEKFSDWVRDELGQLARFPNSGQVYDYYVDIKDNAFRMWTEIVPPFQYLKDQSFSEILVPTMDTVRYSFILETLLEIEHPVLFIGASGTGKSVILQDCLNRIQGPKNLVPFNINFSAQTSSVATQEMIELRLEKKRKGVYGAPAGKKLVAFVDDVNMPQREIYGAQPPVELLRQIIDTVHHFRPSGGMYERKKFFWQEIVDTTFVSACGPPGGGRNPVTPRFFRHFTCLSVVAPSQAVLGVIFTAILSGFLEEFAPEVKALVRPTVTSSLEVYARISEEMLPTPSKSHYTFNLRDLSKVFQGIVAVKPNVVVEARTFMMLWIHECQRVFQDRLICVEDKTWFNQLIHELLKRCFAVDWTYEDVFGGHIMFGDYLRPGCAREERLYEPIVDLGKLGKLMETYQDDYAMASSKSLSLVFFRDAMEHVSRLCRILRQPRGNAMLVGLGGSGKQSLTRMAAFMSDYKCMQIELTRGYGSNEFREDLKKMFLVAGVEREPVVFLFTDTQIVKESFLEDVNGVLNSGDVPNLFASDEKERIINDVRDYAATQGKPETRDGIYSTFIDSVRANLHVVLCMSPVGDSFRNRCRMFPSLINCCTIDWYMAWPTEALLSVSARFLETMEGIDEETKSSLSSMCVTIHTSVAEAAERFFAELRRRYYTTPKSYLDLIDLYCKLLGVKRTQLQTQRERFLNGLTKMTETNAVIDTMQQELTDLKPILAEKTVQTKELLVTVAREQEEASKTKDYVAGETALVGQQAEEVRLVQEDAQRDLDEALPALDSALAALNQLTKGDITEIKSFSKPPPLVQTTMEAVMALLGEKSDWDTAKKQLGDGGFLNRLITFDKDNITAKSLKTLQKYLSLPEYNAEQVGKVSKAAKGMCMWTIAMDVYARVAKEVEPKKARLAEANKTLQEAQATLGVKQAQLAEVEAKVAELQAQLKAAQDEQQGLREQAELCENRLARAGVLTSALGDEAVRWGETADLIKDQLHRLVGDVFLGCSCVSYYGAFTGFYRDELVQMWIQHCNDLNIPVSDDFTLRGTLANPVEVRDWNIWGLPTDSVSIDNGVLVTCSQRWPLLIDPQMQAYHWIKNMEEKNGLRPIKMNDPQFLRTLENSIRVGTPVLLEDVGEELDPALEPILLRQLFKQGGRLLIRLGDSDVDYDPKFKFYITTKRPNPHYMPEVCIKTTIINFTVTMKGLEDQLLGDVVRKERPDLEAQKDRLVVSMANDKKQLKELEDKVLKLLKESEGNILDNKSLISTLEQSKITSKMISERVKEAESTEKAINEAREAYRVAATRGSIMYFVIADLGNMDHMYQYSLTYFQKLFNDCIDSSDKSDDLEERLGNLMTYTTEFMYSTVCRGLFEKHKQIFSFLICTSIMRAAGDISVPEWNYFLRGGEAQPKVKNLLVDANVADLAWNQMAGLEDRVPDAFVGLQDNVKDLLLDWRQWITSEKPHELSLPGDWDAKLTNFQKLLPLRVFRQEKLMFAMASFIKDEMGEAYIEAPPFTLGDVYKDTTCTTPVIFVLSTGADPTASLLRFAEERGYQERLHVISLGQGQGPIAEKLIQNASKRGDWVCLMNCHLATSWMTAMEKMIEGFSGSISDINADFRLWLTSMPAATFPVAVLQSGIKLTNEPPRGLRANVLRSVLDLGQEKFENSPKPVYWQKLFLGLSFFHAIIQERRKYGPLGWNIRYEFNTSDIECAQMVLKMFIEDHDELPWDALEYVTGHINYGGRVTDDTDRRCLMVILGLFYNPRVVSDDTYRFSPSGQYYAPPQGPFEDTIEYVKQLPANDEPEVFGMHDNANIAYQLQETQRMVNTILDIQPRLAAAAGVRSSEEIVDELAEQILAEIPEVLNMEDAAPGMMDPDPKTGALNSLDIVLLQEAERFNTLIKALKRTLSELRKAIKGLVVMSAELELMFQAMLNNSVPELWGKVSYPSLKPLSSWVKDFHQRVHFMHEWLVGGTPKCFWLPGFFFPQGFLTGALQNHARRYTIPIDSLSFAFKVQQYDNASEIKMPPKDGVFVDGLYLEAARWDKRKVRLQTSQPGKMFAPMPVIYFIPSANYVLPKEDYECPLYKTNTRAGVLSTTGASTNFVLNISLPTDKKPDYWVLQGTAMVTMTND